MRRTLERVILAAVLAALAGLDARTEEIRTPDPNGSPLGRGHLWAKFAQADFQDDAVAFWGVDRATHVGLEFYRAEGRMYHLGGEIGSTSAGDLTWRVHRLLVGVDVKYQTAAEYLSYLGHSNVRFGAHMGVAF